jgi:hypothetical protein
MSYRKGYYKKDGTYVQGHFVNNEKADTKMKGNNKKGCLGVFLVILVAILSFSCSSESTCESKKCSNFSSQSEAQSTFESDKNCYSNLDRDNDNIACEN